MRSFRAWWQDSTHKMYVIYPALVILATTVADIKGHNLKQTTALLRTLLVIATVLIVVFIIDKIKKR